MEPTSIPQSELRNDSARILREVAEGREFVITVRGKPVARLSPEHAKAAPVGPRTFVPMEEALPIINRARAAYGPGALEEIRAAYDGEVRIR